MTINDAFSAANPQEAAELLLAAGVSVLPVRGKLPAVASWKTFRYTRMRLEDVPYYFGRQHTGLAVVGGPVSGNLVVIDLDGTEAVERFRQQFPHLLHTLTVESGSGVGQHLYYRTLEEAEPIRLSGFEVRSKGHYTLCPPSIHPKTGNHYVVERNSRVMQVDNLNDVRDWLQAMRPTPEPVPAVAPVTDYGAFNGPWVRAAVMSELHRLRTAPEGEQNNTLNAVSYRLARICANPHSGLDRTEIQTSILDAARSLSHRDGLRATIATMESGWNAGYKRPVTIPEPRHRRR